MLGLGRKTDLGELDSEEALTDPVHLRVRELHKSYGDHHVLKGVSFDVLRGKTNMIIGPSGSGKTVLMRQLIRLERPDSGQILVNGVDIASLSNFALTPVRRKFGMVFQMSALFDSMTVFDNVAFPLREHTRLSRKEIRDRVTQRLRDLRIDHAAKKLPSELSGGMQKRVAVARALVLGAKILIYDEPTTGLDPVTSRKVDELIVEAQHNNDITSIVISHDMPSVFTIGDRITYLRFGVVVMSGTKKDLLGAENAELTELLEASGIDPAILLQKS